MVKIKDSALHESQHGCFYGKTDESSTNSLYRLLIHYILLDPNSYSTQQQQCSQTTPAGSGPVADVGECINCESRSLPVEVGHRTPPLHALIV